MRMSRATGVGRNDAVKRLGFFPAAFQGQRLGSIWFISEEIAALHR